MVYNETGKMYLRRHMGDFSIPRIRHLCPVCREYSDFAEKLCSIALWVSGGALNCLTSNGLGISCSKGRFKLIYTLKRLSGLARAKQEVNTVNPTTDGRWMPFL